MGLAISRSIVESSKKMPRFEGGTGSFTWNKVKSQRARAANRNRPDSGVVRLYAAGRAPLDLAAAHG